MKRMMLLVCFMLFMTGCASTIESFYNRQVVEDVMASDDDRQEIGTLAVTAQRRLIVGNLKTGSFCSEPPPEAADSISTAIAAALKANIAADKEVSAELASNFARHVNQLYKRAHTVQLFRDASYHLCVNAVNKSNGSDKYDSYKTEITSLVNSILPVLQKEIKEYYAVEKARAETPPTVSREAIICDSTATVDKKDGGEESKLTTVINCQSLTAQENDNLKEKEG